MSDMLERVARAIARAHRVGDDFIAADGSRHTSEPWSGFIEHARGAIEAMREPTDAMYCAGLERLQCFLTSPGSIWTAMIDAAMPPPGPPK